MMHPQMPILPDVLIHVQVQYPMVRTFLESNQTPLNCVMNYSHTNRPIGEFSIEEVPSQLLSVA